MRSRNIYNFPAYVDEIQSIFPPSRKQLASVLSHEPRLSITVRIFKWVQLVNDARLLLSISAADSLTFLPRRRGCRTRLLDVFALLMGAHTRGASLKLLRALLRAAHGAQCATLPLVLVHADGRQAGGGVVAGGEVVYLVDRDSGVDDFGLDDVLLDQRLHDLVDMAGFKC